MSRTAAPDEQVLAADVAGAVVAPVTASDVWTGDAEPGGTARVARSARLLGRARLGSGALLAQGTVVRSLGGGVEIGAGTAVLENSVVVGSSRLPVAVGRRSVFGHRTVVVGATVGDLCEVGNATVLLPGAALGNRCFTGEGTLLAPGQTFPDDSVVIGRPARLLRRATHDDRARLLGLRGGSLDLPEGPSAALVTCRGRDGEGTMGRLYRFRDREPRLGEGTVLFDTAEVTGDVEIGRDCVIGAGVRIIGDAHGPVRIGDRVQVLEGTVMHLLPDNELVVGDDVVIGPAAVVHGCRLGARSVVEPAAVLCDWSVMGERTIVRAGSLVPQRAEFGPGAVLEGFPAEQVATLDVAPERPGWAFTPDEVAPLPAGGAPPEAAS